MDETKRRRLIDELSSQTEHLIVPMDRFFDGNDDVGSIGCNLLKHPGIEIFCDTFSNLAQRPDVEAIYARIAELDPGQGCWPFSDTVFVVGNIPSNELRAILQQLDPDEVGRGEDYDLPEEIRRRHAEPVIAAWWD
jgi:hypothetical protein